MTVWLASLRKGNPLATNAALLIFGLITIELCRTGVYEYHHYVHGVSEGLFGQIVLYLGAISLIERCPTNKWTLRIIFVVALAARLVCVLAPPFLSTDLYRYVWDGKVQAAGINPFRYIPADAHLAFLRDSSIYPHINRRDYAHTIYPPGAQMLFFLITRISATATFMKTAMVGFEAATCIVLLRVLDLLRQPRERILLYAWHPLCFWEIASSGHVDAAALTALALALYLRLKNKSGLTGIWLGAATLIKMYPAALLPAFFDTSKNGKGRWCLPSAFVLIVAVGYACYASVGAGVFGFLPTYAQEEGIQSGDRYFLLALVNRGLNTAIPPAAYIALCAIVMLAVCIWALQRGSTQHAFILSSLVVATTLNLLYSPHYPWYFLWILPYLVILPWRPAFYYVTASTYLFATSLGAPGEPLYRLNILLYSGFAAVVVYDQIAARLSRTQPTSRTINAFLPATANARNL